MSALAGQANTGKIVSLGSREAVAGFTLRDRLELERWAGTGRRSAISDDGGVSLAMLYEGCHAWASWAVMRQGAELVLWNCVTFADIGRFSSMNEALAALPNNHAVPWAPLANVVALPQRSSRRWQGRAFPDRVELPGRK